MKALALALILVAVAGCGTYLQMHDKLTTHLLIALGVLAACACAALTDLR